jgi:hypothetical protein
MLLLSIDVGIKNLSFCLIELTNNENNENNISILNWNNIDLSESNSLKCIEKDKKGICNKSCKYFKKENDIIKCYCLKHAKKQNYLLPQNDLKESFLKKQKLDELIKLSTKYNIKYDILLHKKTDLINLLVEYSKSKCFDSIITKNATKIDLVTIGKNIQHKLDIELGNHVSLIDKIIIENQIGPIANKMKTIQGMISQYFIMKNNNILIEFVSATNKLKDFITDKNISNTYKERKKLGIEITTNFVNNDVRFNKWKDYYNKSLKKDDLSDCFLQGMWYIKNKIYKT